MQWWDYRLHTSFAWMAGWMDEWMGGSRHWSSKGYCWPTPGGSGQQEGFWGPGQTKCGSRKPTCLETRSSNTDWGPFGCQRMNFLQMGTSTAETIFTSGRGSLQKVYLLTGFWKTRTTNHWYNVTSWMSFWCLSAPCGCFNKKSLGYRLTGLFYRQILLLMS